MIKYIANKTQETRCVNDEASMTFPKIYAKSIDRLCLTSLRKIYLPLMQAGELGDWLYVVCDEEEAKAASLLLGFVSRDQFSKNLPPIVTMECVIGAVEKVIFVTPTWTSS